MTIDEAIKHCLEVAEKNENDVEVYEVLAKNHENTYSKLTATKYAADCAECAADHRQLAEWLTELKELREENKVLMHECDRLIKEKGELLKKSEQIAEYKRLLKAAVEDNKRVLRENFGDICQFCKHYSNSEAQCRKPHNGSGSWCCENAEWRYAAEALKLLGKDGANGYK